MIVSCIAFLTLAAAVAIDATASKVDSNNEAERLNKLGADAHVGSMNHITDDLGAPDIPNFFDGGFPSGSISGVDVNPPSSYGRKLTGATIQSFAPPDGLFNRECGQVFDIETRLEVINRAVQRMILTADAIFNNPEISGSTFDNYFGPAEDATGRSKLSYQATNGIKAMKICAKCSDYRNKVKPEHRGEYGAFCGEDAYGADSTVSGLALIPVNQNGRVLRGALKGAVWWRGVQSGTFQGPSNRWYTTEEGGLLGAPDSWYGTTTLLGGLMVAGSGQVVIMPDGIGYGESGDCFKGIMIQQLYKTATVPLYLATQEMIADTTNCRSELADTLTVSGYSEGGYATVAAAEAFTSIGYDVTRIRSGAPSTNHKGVVESQTIKFMADKVPQWSIWILPLLYGGYSSTITGLPNFGDLSQSAFSEEGRLRVLPFVIAGFEDAQDLGVLSLFAFNASGSGANAESINKKLINPGIVEYASMGKPFCENPDLGPLCEALDEASLVDSITEAPYPTAVCYSPLDDLIPFLGAFPGGAPLPNSYFFPAVDRWGGFDGTTVPLKNFYGHGAAFGVCTLAFAYDVIDNESMKRQPMSGKCIKKQGKKTPNKNKPV